jgi:NAD(P)-dependent dehydrogenase (short-subunit alcohol dehydrogenase family)
LDVEPSAINLTGQVAIVTGGGRGLGQAMAQALAAAGASVVVTARSEDQLAETVALIDKAGGRVVAIRADVTSWDSVERLAQEVERQFGSIDLLVNNAGIAGPLGPIWETDADEWWQVLDVNLRGCFLCARAVLPGMIRRQRGRIINVGSGASTVPIPYMSAYCTSKAALARFTECLIADAGAQGIAAFTLDPGTVRTAMAEYGIQSDAAKKWIPWFRTIFDEGRDVPPERSAQLVVLLASGRADNLSGSFVSVADDVEAMIRRQSQTDDELYRLRLRQ